MQFSHTDNGSGSKFGKFALVAGLHVAVGALVLHDLGTRTLTLPRLTDQVMVLLEPTRLEPPPPPPDPAPLAAVTSEPQPFPAMPAATAPDAPPATQGAGANSQARPAPMRTAVLPTPSAP